MTVVAPEGGWFGTCVVGADSPCNADTDPTLDEVLAADDALAAELREWEAEIRAQCWWCLILLLVGGWIAMGPNGSGLVRW